MARGGLVDQNGLVVAVFEAAEGLNTHYATDHEGNWLAFVPDEDCEVGDTWDGSSFTPAETAKRE